MVSVGRHENIELLSKFGHEEGLLDRLARRIQVGDPVGALA